MLRSMKYTSLSTCFCAVLFAFVFKAAGQTLGGQSAYSFLKLPSSPMLTAAGGVNVSQRGEIGLTGNNPALLQQDISSQVQVSFNSFLVATKAYALTGAIYSEALQT